MFEVGFIVGILVGLLNKTHRFFGYVSQTW